MATYDISKIELPSGDLCNIVADAKSYLTEVNGSIARFEDGADDYPLKSCIVNIEPVQSGSGTPYPPGGGKNLLPNISATVTQNGVTATKNADGTISVTTATVSANTEIIIAEIARDTTKAYTVSGCPSGGSTSTYRQIIRLCKDGASLQTVSDTGSGYTVGTSLQPTATVIRVSVWIASGQNNKTFLFKPMVEIGSSVTDFAPYSNIRPISGWESVKVYDDTKYAKTITWNQFVKNGNFSNGTNDWTLITQGVTSSVSNNVLTYTITSNTYNYRPNIYQNLDPVLGHKYLLSADIKVTTSVSATLPFSFLFGNINKSVISNLPRGSWTTASCVIAPTATNYKFNCYFSQYISLSSHH